MTAQTQTAVSSDNTARRLARLAAVQGLYQVALTQYPAERVIRDFRDSPPTLTPEQSSKNPGATLADMDQELFGEIVVGVTESEATLDEMIAGACDEKISAARIEILLRAILRAGTYELYRHSKIPTGVIINDYVDVAHAFFGASEPGLVNAVLDRLARTVRQ
jgi:N utilization substance protein B